MKRFKLTALVMLAAVMSVLTAAPPAVGETYTWNFEDGTLFDTTAQFAFTNVPSYAGNGTTTAFVGGNQPMNNEPHRDNWAVNTWGGMVEPHRDDSTGIAETRSFIVAQAGTVNFWICTSPYPWLGGDPDAMQDGQTCFNLEREVAPGDWEMIFTKNHSYNFDWEAVSWDTTPYVGSTVRLRIYDTRTDGWGHTAVDDIEVTGFELPGVVWSDLGVTSFSTTSAVAHATLAVSGGGTDAAVMFYYGTTDRGQTNTGWLGSVNLGTVPVGLVDNAAMSNLTPNTTYYFRFYGTNSALHKFGYSGAGTVRTPGTDEWTGSANDVWGNAANWVSGNVPNTGAESARFVDWGVGNVDLNGSSYSIGPIRFGGGGYTLMDSAGSPGTLTATALTNSAGANAIDVGMTVSGTAAVSGGTLTLKKTDSFGAGQLRLGGGTLTLQGASAVGNGLIANLYYLTSWSPDQFILFHQAGSVLSRTPHMTATDTGLGNDNGPGINYNGTFHTRLFPGMTNPLEAGRDTEHFTVAWTGYFTCQTTGDHYFQSYWADDAYTTYVDVNEDGIFQDGERFAGNWGGTQPQTLTAGHRYKVAFGFSEWEGGENVGFQFWCPTIGDWRNVDPSSGEQVGMWNFDSFGPVTMSGIPVNLTASSTIVANSDTNVATLGVLGIANGVTLTSGSGSPVGFQSATIAAGATAAGFNAGQDIYLTLAGGLNGSGASVTIAKTGAGSLILNQAGSNLGSATFDVQAGELVAVDAGAFGGASLSLNGGTIVLSSPAASDIHYAKSISVAQNSSLTAGMIANGVAGPLTAYLDGTINFTGSQTLAVSATDDYTLRLSGQINGSGTLSLTAGSIVIDDPSFNAVQMNGGSLTVYDNLTVSQLLQNSGSFTMAGVNRNLSVSDALTLAGTGDFTGGPNLVLTTATVTLNNGANLLYDKPLTAGSITINNGGTLNIGGNALNVGTLTWQNGGSLTCGDITASSEMRFWPERTIANKLSGTADVYIGEPEDSWGYVALTGANDYTGKTQIRLGKLRAAQGVGLPAASRLVFNSGSPDWPCVWQTSGTITRDIGAGAGEVSWQDWGGGFAAYGGPLTISLEGNAELSWNDGDAGFSGANSLQLGSEDSTNKTELTNPIRFQDVGETRIQIGNNPNSKGDFVRLSGNISGNGNWDWTFRVNGWQGSYFRNGLVEFTGTNTYVHSTRVQYATLYAPEGVGMPVNSCVAFEAGDYVWNDPIEAIWMSHGTISRTIGWDVGRVHWMWGTGGFAARGGDLTVTLTPNGGSSNGQLNYWDGWTGFSGRWLQLNSQYASNRVELTNPIDLGGGWGGFCVWDNLNTDQDVAVLSGLITGSNHGDRFRKVGPGVLWLRGTNTFTQVVQLHKGVVRIDKQANISANSTIVFSDENTGDDWPKSLESKGTLSYNIGGWSDAGCVAFEWGAGGFSAYGGPLTVRLNPTAGPAVIPWDNYSGRGFNNRGWFHLGSHSANDVVTIANTLDVRGGWRQLGLWGNPSSPNDYAVVTNITDTSSTGNNGHLQTYGDGILKIAGSIDHMNYLRVEDNTTVLINGTFSGNYLDSNGGQNERSIRKYPGWGATPTIGGSGTVTAIEMRLRSWSDTSYTTLAPGSSAGTLNVVGNVVFESNYVRYEWELGPTASDRVAITGNLNLGGGWKVKLLSVGGTPRADVQYNLFTYSGSCSYVAPTLDTSSIPSDWVTSGVTVVHDAVGKRIYLTGLYSLLSVANDNPADLTSTSATLKGFVSAQADPLYVSVYWSTDDGGSSPAAWLANGFKAEKGFYANVTGQSISHPVTGLDTNELWYYTWRATNFAGNIDLWAAPTIAFHASGPPAVTNTGASNIGMGVATLNGAFRDHNRGTVTLCWGTVDGGTTTPAAWQHSVNIGAQSGATFSGSASGLLYPLTYVYRVYATNPYGSAWSAPYTSFAMTMRPAPVPSRTGLEAWYDAAQGITLSGSRPTLWADQSGNGRNAVENGNNNVSYATNQVNGLPAVKFRNGSLSINTALTDAETYIVFKSGRYAYDPGNPNYWGPDWSSPFGQQDGRHWMMQGGSRQFWNDGGWDQPPTAVTQNGTPVAQNNGDGSPFGLSNVDRYMVLKVDERVPENKTCYLGRNGGWQNGYFDVAEVLVYSATLSAQNESLVGGYLATKYGIAGAYPTVFLSNIGVPSIVNLQATGVGVSQATMNARLSCTGAVYSAWVHWGDNDGGTTLGDWDNHVFVGTVTGTAATVSKTISTGSGTWYYTYQASNALDQIWAAPSTNFTTVSSVSVDNDGGAVTNIGQATLRGTLLTGSQADIYVYWGRTDGVTTPGSWENVVKLADTLEGAFQTTVNVGYGYPLYYYTCFASNEAGTAWAAASTSFTMPQPQVSPPGGGIELWMDASAIVGLSNGQTVNPWNDKSGNGHNTTSIQSDPAYYSSVATLNNRPAVHFDGDDGFYLGNLSGSFPSAATLFVVADLNNDNEYNLYSTRNNDTWWRYGNSWGYNGTFRNGRWDNIAVMPTAGSHVFMIESSASAYKLLDNGTQLNSGGGNYNGGEDHRIGMHDNGAGGKYLSNGYIAEVLIYDRILTAEEQTQAGSYLATKYGLTTSYPTMSAGASVTNTAVSSLSTNSARLNGLLSAHGYSFDVYVYYGRTNGLNVAADWEHSAFVGTFHSHTTSVSYAVGSLALTSQYYYAYMITNAVTNIWAQPSMGFQTLGSVRAQNAGVSGITQTRATLSGRLAEGGFGELRVYWGLTDGGTTAANWQHTNSWGNVLLGTYITNLPVLAGAPYYYRVYATNGAGEDWADTTATFQTPRPAVTLSTLPVTAGFSPANISGCVAWYRADAGVTTPGDVLTWADQSGNGHTAARNEGTMTLAANQINGKPAVQFRDNAYANATGNMYSREQYGVVRLLNGDWGALMGCTQARTGYMLNQSGNFWDSNYPQAVKKNGTDVGGAPFSLGDDGPFMLVKITGNAWDTRQLEYSLGRTEGWRSLNMDLAELVVYDRMLTAAEENQVGAYLAGKYGLVTTYPYMDEVGRQAAVTATLSNPSVSNVTVNFTFDASRGTDYDSSANTTVVTAGTLSSSITLTGIDDTLQEEDETLTISVSSLHHATNGSPVAVNPVITSDDPEITNASGATGVNENSATLNGVLTKGDGATVKIYWGDNDGGTVFGNWDSVVEMGIQSEDSAFTNKLTGLLANKTYYYRCYATNSSLLHADWADSTASFLTTRPSVSITDVTVSEGDAGTVNATFTLTTTTRSFGNMSVRCTAADGTASAGSDYAATNAIVVIPANQWSATFTVKVSGDTDFEYPDQTFYVNLTLPSSCLIADAQGMGTILDDDAAAYLANFQNWLPITFSGYSGTSTLTNWPALVRLSTSIAGFNYSSFASASGGDLRFANAARTRVLNFEIERWDTNGQSVVWVQIPALPAGGTTLYAYWNNPGETSQPGYATNGATWNDGYAAVWHMGSVNTADASQRGHEGTAQGGVNNVSGIIGRANEFDVGEYIRVPSSTDWQLQSRDFAMSSWVYSHDIGGEDGIFGTWGSQFIFGTGNGNVLFHANAPVFWYSNGAITQNAWNYVTITRQGLQWRVYVNGVVRDSNPQNGGDRSIDSYRELEIGTGGPDWHGWWDGMLDEPRIETKWRSTDWVKANYDNQRLSSTFNTYGTVQGKPSITVVYGATNITFTSAFVTARLTSTGGVATTTRLYWGETNGGQVPGNWTHTQDMGLATSVPRNYSVQLTPLTEGTQYFYAYAASNAFGTTWAATDFFTKGVPFVNNGSGATTGVSTATMRGYLTSTGGVPTRVFTYWGDNDGATTKSAWDRVITNGVRRVGPFSSTVSNLLYGVRYYYRTYATNANGDGWAPSTTNFLTKTPNNPNVGVPVTSGLVCHFDAGKGVVSDGSGVLTWADQSGNGHNGTRASGNPTLVANQLNGKPIIQFRNNNSYLDMAGTLFAKEHYYVFRCRPDRDTWSNYGCVLGKVGDDRSSSYLFESGNRGFHSNQFPDQVHRDGANISSVDEDCLPDTGKAINQYMVLKVMVNNNNTGVTSYRIGGQGGYIVDTDVAEIIGYSAPLTVAQENLVGGYLAGKYAITTTYPPAPAAAAVGITNAPATGITETEATLNAVLDATGSVFQVTAYWGTTDGGTSAASWANSAIIRTYTNVRNYAVSHPLSSLPSGERFYFSFRAQNAATNIWGEPGLQFATLGAPVVDNASGATPAPDSATLNGTLVSDGGAAATVKIYWGDNDGGTVAGSWDHEVDLGVRAAGPFASDTGSGLLFGQRYYYRTYASSVNGERWASSTANFLTVGQPPYVNGIEETIFDSASGDPEGDIEGYRTRAETLGANDAQGVLTGRMHYENDPAVQARAEALGAVGFESGGDFAMLWVCEFVPTESGAWGFRTTHVDDGYSFWIDTDRNGTFEMANRFYSRGCCEGSGDQYTPALTAGTRYLLGVVMSDTGGGGDFQNFSFKAPSGSWTYVEPSQPAQDGLWRVPGIASGAQVTITNLPATLVTASSARLHGQLGVPGAVATVTLYWGDNDGGTVPGAWDNTVPIGTYTNADATNLSYQIVGGLAESTPYYYTFLASNAASNTWAQPAMPFYTTGRPLVSNGSGAAPHGGYARLNGNLLSTGGDATTVYTYWGDNDGGTTAGNWDYAITNGTLAAGLFSADTPMGSVVYGATYYYRTYAVNGNGSTWAASTVPFVGSAWVNQSGGNWSDGARWNGGVAPAAGGSPDWRLEYNTNTYSGSSVNDLGDGFQLNRLTFGAGHAPVVLSGDSLALASYGGNQPQVIQSGANGVSVQSDLVLSADTTFGGGGAGTVILGGDLGGAGGLIKTGVGTLVMTSTNNSYSGATTVSGGILKLGGATMSVTAGLEAWYDAAVGTTSDGTGLLNWADRSANGRTAERVDVHESVRVVDSQVNGLPAVQFRRTAMNINSSMNAMEQYVVFKSAWTGWGAPYNRFGEDWTSPIGRQDGGSWMLQAGTQQMWDGNRPNAVKQNGTACTLIGNNWQLSNVDQYMVLKVNPVNQNGTYRLGKNGDWWNGYLDVAEILVYSRTLSGAEENTVGTYLAEKYGITTTYASGTPGNVLPTNTTVILSGSGLLELGTVTNRVAALVINGSSQPAGAWGPIGSGAEHESTFLIGSGVLLVGGAAITHELNYTAGAGGSISGVSPQTVVHGGNGTQVTAVPNAGYHFVQWSDSVMTASRTDLNVTGDLSVTATFAINTYTLTYSAGAGGSVSGVSPQTVNHGANGTQVTAVPNGGYHFVRWSDNVMTASRTDLNVTGNLSVSAVFAINTYTLTYSAGANGSVSGVSPQTINHGSNGTQVTAVPDTGYHFLQWSDNVMTASRTELNVTANLSVTASFEVDAVVINGTTIMFQ